MASGLTTFLVVAGVGVGGYALYRWWEEDKKHGDHWRRKEAQHLRDAHATGYFAGVQSGPAIVGADYYVGQGKKQPPDPRDCLCPMTLDPLDPRLPDAQGMVKCPCNTPGAVRPPYAGYMAVGRGGYHHHHPHWQQQQDQQQQQPFQQFQPEGDPGDGGGMPGMPGMPQMPGGPMQPGPGYGHHMPFHPHHGRR